MKVSLRSSRMMGVLTALLFFSLGSPAARGVDLHGVIREVNGDVVTVIVEGDMVPISGDKVAIFFKLAGLDDEISVASGHVVDIVNESIKVKIVNITGTVAKDQLARITSENPRKRDAVAEAKSVTPPATPLPQSPNPSPKQEPGKTIAQRSEVEMMASTVVTFDEQAVGPFAADAFAAQGLRFVPTKGVPGIYKAEPNMILPSPCTKVMLVGGERVTSFTILLDPPVKRLALYRIGAANGASVPTWKMTAYDTKGNVVGSTGEQHNLPRRAMHFSIDAANITRAEIKTDNRNGSGTWATWNSLPIVGFGFDR